MAGATTKDSLLEAPPRPTLTSVCSPVVLSEALTPERILIFFGPESSLEITELLSRTFENMDWLHVLNSVRRVQPANLICPTFQVLHGRVPGIYETKAALAVSRLGTDGLTESQTRLRVILILLSPLGDRFSERAFLRKATKLFATRPEIGRASCRE